jgi:phage FluMu protein Com
MKKQQETVYRCEHCNKAMFGAGAMSRHEKYCPKNPNNQHKCFDFCKHLKREFTYSGDNYNIHTRITNFTCKLTGKKMYSYKFEKNTIKPATALNGLERMPLKCDLHKYMSSYNDID